MNGVGREAGEALVNDVRVDGITFTGSTTVGRHIASVASGRMARVHMELGGKNPLLVLKDADVVEAAAIIAQGAFMHAGQICMASSRVIAEKEIARPLAEALVARAEAMQLGDLYDPKTAYGPLINKASLEKVPLRARCAPVARTSHTRAHVTRTSHTRVARGGARPRRGGVVAGGYHPLHPRRQVRAHCEAAVSDGAELLTGGVVHHGLVWKPTVFFEPRRTSAVWKEETFGPVTSIVAVDSLEVPRDRRADARRSRSALPLRRHPHSPLGGSRLSAVCVACLACVACVNCPARVPCVPCVPCVRVYRM